MFASAKISKIGGEWKKFETTLKTKSVPASKDNVFKLTTTVPGTLWLQNVSLFPPAYRSARMATAGHHGMDGGHEAKVPPLSRRQLSRRQRVQSAFHLEGNHRAGGRTPRSSESVGLLVHRRLGFALNSPSGARTRTWNPLLGVFAGYCLGRGGVIPAGPALEPYVQEPSRNRVSHRRRQDHQKWGATRERRASEAVQDDLTLKSATKIGSTAAAATTDGSPNSTMPSRKVSAPATHFILGL